MLYYYRPRPTVCVEIISKFISMQCVEMNSSTIYTCWLQLLLQRYKVTTSVQKYSKLHPNLVRCIIDPKNVHVSGTPGPPLASDILMIGCPSLKITVASGLTRPKFSPGINLKHCLVEFYVTAVVYSLLYLADVLY